VKKVSSYAGKLFDLIGDLEGLVPELRRMMETSKVKDVIAHFRHEIDTAILPSRSGNTPEVRLNKARKIRAAVHAHQLLLELHGPRPTGYRDGAWVKLSAILFEVATGQKDPDLYDVCCEVLKHWQEMAALQSDVRRRRR
jgi:hypothetical protein